VIRELRPELLDEIERCKRTLSRSPGSEAVAAELEEFKRLANAVEVQLRVGCDSLIGHIDERGTVVLEPVMAAPFARPLLWRHGERFLIASASLVDPLGWKAEFAVISRPSPFPVDRRRVRFMPVGSMSQSDEGATYPLMVRKLREILDHHRGERGLVHAVSYPRARRLAEDLDDARVIPTKGPKQSLVGNGQGSDPDLERFKATPGAVLISPRYERGVSLDHDLCRFIVAAKVPYAHCGDPRVQARRDLDDGEHWYLTVEPARRLLQMTGRATRSADDWSVTYLLDAKFERFLRSDVLPAWWREAVVR
jgi:Rad3-related DNA helicase